jgi:hypothetical protein
VTTVLPVLAWTLTSFLNGQAASELSAGFSEAPSVESAVSLERIRAALDRPVVLDLRGPQEEPDFKVQIIERHEYADWLKPLPDDFKVEDPLANVPLANYNFASLIGKLVSSIKEARREGAERNARDEVDNALEAFCAVNDCPAPAATARTVRPPR